MKKSIIKSTGKAVPSRVVTNNDLVKLLDTTDEWIKQRTGIEQHYWVPEDAMDQNLIGKSGDVVMFTGLGAGITWGGVLYKFP